MRIALLTALLLHTTAVHAQQSLVVNGGFEDSQIGKRWSILGTIAGWRTVSGPGMEVQSNSVGWRAQEGNQMVELDSTAPSAIAQDLNTGAGSIYELSVAFSPRPGVVDNRIGVSWNGQQVAVLDASGAGAKVTNWQRFTYRVTATGATTELRFTDLSRADQLGGLIDDIKVLSAGKVFVNGDEWTLSDKGFQEAPDAGKFTQNLATWFSGGKPGKFLVYSSNKGLTQNSFLAALKAAGHSVTVNRSATFTLKALLGYDAVFLAENPADNTVLIEYVKNGGGVYLAAGTGSGGAAAEAARWNTFLNAFGLKLEPEYIGSGGTVEVSSSAHPVFAGVSKLFSAGANPVTNVTPGSPARKVFSELVPGKSLLGSFEASLSP